MIKQFIFSFIATLTFGILFNIKGEKLFYSALGGGISYLLYFVLLSAGYSQISSTFFVSILIGTYGEIMARVIKTPVTIFIISAIIPLVPGGGLYYTMYYTISENYSEALKYGMDTFQIAVIIVISVLLVGTISKFINKIKKSADADSAGEP